MAAGFYISCTRGKEGGYQAPIGFSSLVLPFGDAPARVTNAPRRTLHTHTRAGRAAYRPGETYVHGAPISGFLIRRRYSYLLIYPHIFRKKYF